MMWFPCWHVTYCRRNLDNFDRDVVHQGRSNKYTFVIEGKKYVLAPLTTYQVSEDYLVMKEVSGKNKNHRGKRSTIVPKEESTLA